MAAVLPSVDALEDFHGDADVALDLVLSAADSAERGEIDLLDIQRPGFLRRTRAGVEGFAVVRASDARDAVGETDQFVR